MNYSHPEMNFRDVVTLAGVSAGSLASNNFVGGLAVPGSSTGLTLTANQAVTGLVGDRLDDVLQGNAEANELRGQGGNDLLSGAGGDDSLYGGDGNDTVHGGDGADQIAGGDGDDTLDGGAGADVLNSGAGNDMLEGGSGNDTLIAAGGNNRLAGGEGDDLLRTSADGTNLLLGGAGDDVLEGGSGNDTLEGGAGNDTLTASLFSRPPGSYPSAISLNGGDGDDLIRFGASIPQHVTATLTATGGAGRDTFHGFISGTDNAFVVTDFQAGALGDRITVDHLFYSMTLPFERDYGNPFAKGNLVLVQRGADTLLRFDRDGSAGAEAPLTLMVLANVAATSLIKDNFSEGFAPDGSLAGLTVTGTAAAESLYGGYVDDIIIGGAGADEIFARGGRDRITGGAGDDVIDGSAGIDTAVYLLAASNYKIGANGSRVTASSGDEGADILYRVERLSFADKKLAFDDMAANVYRLYQAAFDRTPDTVGLGFWLAAVERGMPLSELSAHFVAAPEFTALYGANPSNTQIVSRFYANILERAPDPVGYAFWNDILERKAATVDQVLAEFSQSAENKDALAVVIGQGMEYTEWL